MSNPKKSQSKSVAIHGIHAVISLLNHSPESISVLFLNKNRTDEKFKQIIQLAKLHSIPIQYVSNLEKHTQGVLAECDQSNHSKANTFPTLKDLLQHHAQLQTPLLFLVLDNIQDPHNLGACIRTANASGADAVIIPQDKSASLTPTVKKVAVGAVEYTPIYTVTNLSRTLSELKEHGVWIYGMEGTATKSIYSENFKQSTAFVLGLPSAVTPGPT